MRNTKHTPGPWVATSDNNTYPGYLIRSDSKPGYIAEIRAFTTQDEVDANKSLIAAAPEMYDLLKEIARGPYEDSDCRSLCEAYAARAQALIDKARGEDGIAA